MGQFLEASCRNCGFEQKFRFGAGKLNFKTNFDAPAINKDNEFVVVNYFEEKDNPDFEFYNSPKLNKDLSGSKISWGNFEMYSTNNKCPYCNEYTLDFLRVGFFD